jgi:glutathione S-transferase
MIKLYGSSFSRAAIVKWYLEELHLPYEFISVEIQKGEQFQPEYVALHPFAKVPTIDDNGFILWESGAILTYLASKYDPTVNTPEKIAIVNQWVIFANSTLSDGIFAPQFQAKETPRLLGKLNEILSSKLNEILSSQPYLIGETFSAGDVAVCSLLGYIPMMLKDFDFTPYPHVMNYMQRLKERPGFMDS